jgi:hypothetical protein
VTYRAESSDRVPGQLFLALAMAALTCAILASCTGASTPGAARSATASPTPSAASSQHATGPLGGPGNPLVLSCAAESWPGYPDPPASARPGPNDLPIGPMYFAGGRTLATETPAQYGYAPFGRRGRFYKFGVVVRPGAAVTVTIGPSARGHAVISLAANGQQRDVTSATYHACRRAGGFFAQGFAFTRPPFRGCVPLDVTVSGQARVRHPTLSLFAGSCPA